MLHRRTDGCWDEMLIFNLHKICCAREKIAPLEEKTQFWDYSEYFQLFLLMPPWPIDQNSRKGGGRGARAPPWYSFLKVNDIRFLFLKKIILFIGCVSSSPESRQPWEMGSAVSSWTLPLGTISTPPPSPTISRGNPPPLPKWPLPCTKNWYEFRKFTLEFFVFKWFVFPLITLILQIFQKAVREIYFMSWVRTQSPTHT